MYHTRSSVSYPQLSYISPDTMSSEGQTAQNYIDGLMQYWDHHANMDSEDRESLGLTPSEALGFDQDTPSSETDSFITTPRPVIPQFQSYHEKLLALEQKNNLKQTSNIRERQLQSQKDKSEREQRKAAAPQTHVTVAPPLESYRSYLISVQAQNDSRLQQVREEQEEREAEEHKRELERILMRRKDSGIYCETIIKGYDDDCPIPEEMDCDDVPFARQDARIDGWVEAQAQRRMCGFADDVMLPKKHVHDGLHDFRRPSTVAFERYHEQIMEQRRRAEMERKRAVC